jgi:hypothetical protein
MIRTFKTNNRLVSNKLTMLVVTLAQMIDKTPGLCKIQKLNLLLTVAR